VIISNDVLKVSAKCKKIVTNFRKDPKGLSFAFLPPEKTQYLRTDPTPTTDLANCKSVLLVLG
jgi:hypothetical protein